MLREAICLMKALWTGEDVTLENGNLQYGKVQGMGFEPTNAYTTGP
jgi:hypothetical protein